MRRLILFFLCCLLLTGLYPAGAAQQGPIPLATAADLAGIRDNPAASYVLTRHINLAGVNWVPIPFSGRLDGGGYSIYNLRIQAPGPDRAEAVDGNHKRYDTRFAGLFSVVRGAEISNLHLRNIQLDVTTEDNCFAAGLAGFAEDTAITNCSVTGRIRLTQSAKMTGVGGLVGFGLVQVKDSKADVELVFVDTNKRVKCEQFLGGILACGYGDIEGCTVKLQGYASVFGYVHNGGLVGMYHVHRKADEKRKGYVKGCSVDAFITFFERNDNRRAYSKAYLGEKLNKLVKLSDNQTIAFQSKEVRKYKTPLLPEKDENPAYQAAVTPPTADSWGYTTYTCPECGYSYTDEYVEPVGTP